MNTQEAIRAMIEKGGKSQAELSSEMGKSSRFISTTLSKGSVPRVDTFSHIAHLTGYEVVLRGHGEEIVVDPPSDR